MASSDRNKVLLAGVASGIKQYADIMAQREKIKGDILLNQFQMKQNQANAEKMARLQSDLKRQEQQTLNPLEQQRYEIQELLKNKFKEQLERNPNMMFEASKSGNFESITPSIESPEQTRQDTSIEQPENISYSPKKGFDVISGTKRTIGSAMTERDKQKRTENIFTGIEENNYLRNNIRNAIDATQNIDYGVGGKISRGIKTTLGINDPMLGEWQKIKNVLTDAQLLNTAKTKGAISDREMELFSNAAANDDIASLPKIKVVLDNMINRLNAQERGQVNAYKKLYGENPYEWEGVKSNIETTNKQDNITLPDTIKTTSEAIKYLVSQGMDQDEAINWLRSQ